MPVFVASLFLLPRDLYFLPVGGYGEPSRVPEKKTMQTAIKEMHFSFSYLGSLMESGLGWNCKMILANRLFQSRGWARSRSSSRRPRPRFSGGDGASPIQSPRMNSSCSSSSRPEPLRWTRCRGSRNRHPRRRTRSPNRQKRPGSALQWNTWNTIRNNGGSSIKCYVMHPNFSRNPWPIARWWLLYMLALFCHFIIDCRHWNLFSELPRALALLLEEINGLW